MHDSENGTHSATAAETLVLTNNMVYSEPSTYFDTINHHHHQYHHHHHHNPYHDHLHRSTYEQVDEEVNKNEKEERGDDELVDDEEVDADEDEDDEDEEDEDDDDNDDNDDDDDDDDDVDESEDDSEDIVDPGQPSQQSAIEKLNENASCVDINGGCNSVPTLTTHPPAPESLANDILDGDRMLEVTRKLVRLTERDPDRDLRKQVLLKTAIKKLPQFMEYNRYTDSLDRSFHNTSQTYYEHHDTQPKFYHSVQPNAIQMSTTSLRMLDLNDDQDPELGTIEPEHSDPNLGYSTRTNLENDYVANQAQYDRYHQQSQDINPYDTNSPMIGRHNSLDNLYQPMNGDLVEDMKDSDERIPIAFQIACELYDFSCVPDDNERKLLDNLTNGYYKTTKEPKNVTNVSSDTYIVDQDGSDSSSSSTSSSSDDSANSNISQSHDTDDLNGTSLLEASLHAVTNEFYHSSHDDSGVALFSPRSNKRSSSAIGFDDEMEIDHQTETRAPIIESNSQHKKLRKRETID